MTHRSAIAGQGGGVWTPPQLASLVAAWVSGLSGSVAKLGSWAGQYGTLYDATMYGDANVGASGLDCDGTGDIARTSGSPEFTTSVAWAAWVYRRTIGADFAYASNNVGTTLRWQVSNITGNASLFISTNGSEWIRAYGAAIPSESWTHIAVSWISGSKPAIWVNGTRANHGTEITGGLPGVPNTITIGAGWYNNAINSPANVLMDCVYTWSGVMLTDDDVASLRLSDPHRMGT